MSHREPCPGKGGGSRGRGGGRRGHCGAAPLALPARGQERPAQARRGGCPCPAALAPSPGPRCPPPSLAGSGWGTWGAAGASSRLQPVGEASSCLGEVSSGGGRAVGCAGCMPWVATLPPMEVQSCPSRCSAIPEGGHGFGVDRVLHRGEGVPGCCSGRGGELGHVSSPQGLVSSLLAPRAVAMSCSRQVAGCVVGPALGGMVQRVVLIGALAGVRMPPHRSDSKRAEHEAQLAKKELQGHPRGCSD